MDVINVIRPGEYTHDPRKHVIVFGGVKVADYAEDVGIEMDFEPFRSVQKGVTGAVTYSEYATRSGTFKIHILQGSPLISILEEFCWKDGKDAIVPMTYADMTLEGAGYFAGSATILKAPSKTIGKDAKEVVFEITAPQLSKMK